MLKTPLPGLVGGVGHHLRQLEGGHVRAARLAGVELLPGRAWFLGLGLLRLLIPAAPPRGSATPVVPSPALAAPAVTTPAADGLAKVPSTPAVAIPSAPIPGSISLPAPTPIILASIVPTVPPPVVVPPSASPVALSAARVAAAILVPPVMQQMTRVGVAVV